jgi:hypothetical protein
MIGSEPTQTPDWHASVWVQALPSSQARPSGSGGFVQMPVDGLQAPAVWHWSGAGQVTPMHRSMATHDPSVQVWPIGQGWPHVPQLLASIVRFKHAAPLQSVRPDGHDGSQVPVVGLQTADPPSGCGQTTGVLMQPIWTSHESVVQGLLSSQFLGAPAQTPLMHTSLIVQMSPSSQPAPFCLSGLVQTPVVVLQVPATWHWSNAGQTTAVPLTHAPAWHASPIVQASPSSHVVPFGRLEKPVALVAGVQT